MSKADKMFEKMGYKKSYQKSIYNKVWGILYKNEKSMINISFDMGNDGESDYEEAHMVCVYIQAFDERTEPAYITMQELQAINEKVKELRLDRRRR